MIAQVLEDRPIDSFGTAGHTDLVRWGDVRRSRNVRSGVEAEGEDDAETIGKVESDSDSEALPQVVPKPQTREESSVKNRHPYNRGTHRVLVTGSRDWVD